MGQATALAEQTDSETAIAGLQKTHSPQTETDKDHAYRPGKDRNVLRAAAANSTQA